MKRQFYFCDKWSSVYKEPLGVMTEVEAEAAHAAKKTYTVLVDSDTAPHCFLDIGGKFVFVGFLDSKLRETLSYTFSLVEPGKLFLKMAIERKFDGDSDKVKSANEFTFKPEGIVSVRQVICLPETIVEKFDSHVSASGCYAVYPSFGEYDDLIVAERDIKPV